MGLLVSKYETMRGSWSNSFRKSVYICRQLHILLCAALGKSTQCKVYTGYLWLFLNSCLHVGARAYSRAYFGQGTGRIFLTNVGCTGRESRLLSCRYSTPYSYYSYYSCRHYEDAGVRCPGSYNKR